MPSERDFRYFYLFNEPVFRLWSDSSQERSELNCAAGITMSTAKLVFGAEMGEHRLVALVQWGAQKNQALMAYQGRDVPSVTDFVKSEHCHRFGANGVHCNAIPSTAFATLVALK